MAFVNIPRSDSNRLHVVAGVVRNSSGEILLARRHMHAHLGGLWEFPGGKVETDEPRFDGLVRELREELGIEVVDARPLIQVPFDYPEKSVLLDVWDVQAYSGRADGREGQDLAWVAPDELSAWPMPAADKPIVTAIQIPDRYLVTPEPEDDRGVFLARLEAVLVKGIGMVQLRATLLDDLRYLALAQDVLECCERFGARLLLNHTPEMVRRVGAHGLHLNSRRLMGLHDRPLGPDYLVAGSCHGGDELLHAERIGLDFAVLGPVMPTITHPEATPLRWESFAELVAMVSIPVYALGGMSVDDIEVCRQKGGQGIAAIRALWN